MKKLKWTLNDISFNRGNYRPVIARFNNSKCWLGIPAMTTTSSARVMFRELAIAYGATSVELKYFYDDTDQQTEFDVVDFLKLSAGYKFRNELQVPAGTRRQFKEYPADQIFEL